MSNLSKYIDTRFVRWFINGGIAPNVDIESINGTVIANIPRIDAESLVSDRDRLINVLNVTMSRLNDYDSKFVDQILFNGTNPVVVFTTKDHVDMYIGDTCITVSSFAINEPDESVAKTYLSNILESYISLHTITKDFMYDDSITCFKHRSNAEQYVIELKQQRLQRRLLAAAEHISNCRTEAIISDYVTKFAKDNNLSYDDAYGQILNAIKNSMK